MKQDYNKAMLSYNISTLKNQLSAILKKVKRGEDVLIVDRSQPIAKISKVSQMSFLNDEATWIGELEAKGIADPCLSKLPSQKWLSSHQVQTKGISAVKILLQEREESW